MTAKVMRGAMLLFGDSAEKIASTGMIAREDDSERTVAPEFRQLATRCVG